MYDAARASTPSPSGAERRGARASAWLRRLGARASWAAIRPRGDRRAAPPAGGAADAPRVWPIFAVAVFGVALTASTWLVFSRWEDGVAEQKFDARASNVASALQNGVDHYLAKVLALRALFEASPDGVTRAQFDTFATRLLRGQKAILSVSWVPRVAGADRADHEREGEREGLAGYRIRGFDERGRLAIAPSKDEYFPVFYAAPTEPDVAGPSIYGLDLGDGGTRQRPIERARDADRMAASAIFNLQDATGDRAGFFVVLPVYRGGAPHDTLDDRRRNLVGLVQAVFQISVLTQSTVSGISAPIDFYVLARDGAPFALFLLDEGPQRYRGDLGPRWRDAIADRPQWAGDLEVADLDWKVVAAPASRAPFEDSTAGWVFLGAGLLLTGGASGWMWRSARYAARLSQANARVSRLAYADQLTSLANRRALTGRLAQTCDDRRESQRPHALIYLDLDRFKDVNDTLGHSVGDALLREAAARISATIAGEDFAARLGGDEFAVLQDNASNPTATCALAARILGALAEPYRLDGATIRLTASAGVAFSTPAGGDSETMMMQADLSLHRAKEDGRNGFRCHDEAQDRQILDRARLSEDLHSAIARDEIELYYQPQVEIASGRLIGLEALARWNHPRRGPVPPAIFIPIAERAGLIVELGRWVFDEACRQTAVWRRDGVAPEIVAANVSAIQCKQSDFERELARSMAQWNVDPRTIELELTESVLMDATNEHRDIVERLRRLGVRIAIDDFGTGYSSLSYLANYPVDRLKIAQQLIIGVELDARHASVARMAIHLARELGVDVIAEGVENEAQARFLVSAGCGSAQGFLFGAPLSAASTTELLRDKAAGSKLNPFENAEIARR